MASSLGLNTAIKEIKELEENKEILYANTAFDDLEKLLKIYEIK